MRAQLVPLDGGQPIEVVKDLSLVGRKEDCDLQLNHKSVSKQHCVIVKTDGMLLVRDLGSTNGTRVNGQRIRRAVLLPNDQLTIATFKFTVQLGPDAAPAKAIPSEFTQQLDADEVAALLRHHVAQRAANDDSEELPSRPLNPNPLPDVYPDDDRKH